MFPMSDTSPGESAEDGESTLLDVGLEWLRDHVMRYNASVTATEWFGMLQKAGSKSAILAFLRSSETHTLAFTTFERRKGLKVSTEIPKINTNAQDDGTLVYFLKQDRRHKFLTSNVLSANIISGSMPLFSSKEGKLASLFQTKKLLRTVYTVQKGSRLQKQFRWSDAFVADLGGVFDRFLSDLEFFQEKMTGDIMLPMPAAANTGVRSLTVTGFEQLLKNWWKHTDRLCANSTESPALRDYTMMKKNMAGKDVEQVSGSLNELNKWQSQARQLSRVISQLNHPSVQKMMGVLQNHNSAFVHAHELRLQHLKKASLEATENFRLLEPLRKPLHRLWDGCQKDMINAIPNIPWVFRCLSNIWRLSYFYCNEKRVQYFLKAFCSDLVFFVSEHVHPEKIFGDNPVEDLHPVFDAVRICAYTEKLYFNEKRKVEAMDPKHNWNSFDDGVIFSRLQHFVRRCMDIRAVLETELMFKNLKTIKLLETRLESLNVEVAKISESYARLAQRFKSIFENEAIFDVQNDSFNLYYRTFVKRSRRLEERIAKIVEMVFEYWDSSPDSAANADEGHIAQSLQTINALDAVSAFQSFFECNAVKVVWEKRFPAIVGAINGDVIAVQRLFKNNRDCPVVSENMPTFAGAVMWAQALDNRANYSFKKIKTRLPISLHRTEMFTGMKHRLNSFNSSIGHFINEKYEDFCAWIKSMEDGIVLKGTVLRRVAAFQGMAMDPTKNIESLKSAFDAEDCEGKGTINASQVGACLLTFNFHSVDGDNVRSMIAHYFRRGKETFSKEDVIFLWTTARLNVRLAFESFDEDASGFIDHDEFSHLLRSMGVVFTATQFQQALSQLDPNNDGIDFDEFLEWWADFHTDSAHKLLSVNIDPNFVQLLKEIHYFKSMGMDIPPEAEQLSMWEESFRSHKAHLEFIVTLYNGIHVTLLSVERPLLRERMQSIEALIEKATTIILWRPESEMGDSARHDRVLKEFLSATLVQINEFASKLQGLKQNLKLMEIEIVTWSKEPLFYHSNTDTQNIDIKVAVDRLKEQLNGFKDRQSCLSSHFANAKKILNSVINKTRKMPKPPSTSGPGNNKTPRRQRLKSPSPSGTSESEQSPWEKYVDFWNSCLFRGLKNMVKGALVQMLQRMGFDREGNALDKDPQNRLFEVNVVMFGALHNNFALGKDKATPDICFYPCVLSDTELKEVEWASEERCEDLHSMSFQAQVHFFVETVFRLGKCFLRFPVEELSEEHFFESLDRDEELCSLRANIYKCLQQAVNEAILYKNSNLSKYSELWSTNQSKYMKEFVQSPKNISFEMPLVLHDLSNSIPKFAKERFETVLNTFYSHQHENGKYVRLTELLAKTWISNVPDLHPFYSLLNKFTESYNEVGRLKSESNHRCIKMNINSAQASIKTLIISWIEKFTDWLKDFLSYRIKDLHTFIAVIEYGLTGLHASWMPGEYEREDLGLACGYVTATRNVGDRFEVVVGPLYDINDLLEKFTDNVPIELTVLLKELPNKWSRLSSAVLVLQTSMSKVQSIERDNVFRKEQLFCKQVDELRKSLDRELPMIFFENTEEAFDTIAHFETEHTALMQNGYDLQTEELMFELDLTDIAPLEKFKASISACKSTWDLICRAKDSIARWGSIRWQSITPQWCETLSSDAQTTKQAFSTLPHRFQNSQAVATMFTKLDKLVSTVRIILELKHTAMRRRHFFSIQMQTGLHFVVEDVMNGTITLHTLNSILLVQYAEIIRKVIDVAIRQYSVERALENTAKTWTSFWFKFRKDKDAGNILVSIEPRLYEMLEDNQVLLQNILLGTNLEPFMDSILLWKSNLTHIYKLLRGLEDLQLSWRQAHDLLGSGSNEIQFRKLAPNIVKSFSQAENAFKAFYEVISVRLTISSLCAESSRLTAKINDLRGLFLGCVKGIQDLINKRRGEFPRFYFLDSKSLLALISCSGSARSSQKFLRLLFDGVSRATITDSNSICAIHSIHGETVSLIEHCACEGRAEEWLSRLDELLKETVKRDIFEAFLSRQKSSSTVPRGVWILKHMSQAIITSSNVIFSMEVRKCFQQIPDARNKLGTLAETIEADTSETILLIRSDLRPSNRVKCADLISLEIYHRDIVHGILNSNWAPKEKNACPFEWEKVLRLRWEKTEALSDPGRKPLLRVGSGIEVNRRYLSQGNISGRCLDYECQYQYEYTPAGNCLAITPLTERCCISILQNCLWLNHYTCLSGPSGVGKSATLASVAKLLGRATRTFQCTQTVKFVALVDFVVGILETGMWGICKDIHTLPVSTITLLMPLFSEGLHLSKCAPASANIAGKTVRVGNIYGSILTTLIPQRDKMTKLDSASVLRRLAISVPDSKQIFLVKLISEGYTDAAALSANLVALHEAVEATCQGTRARHSLASLATFLSGIILAKQIRKNKKVTEAVSLSEAFINILRSQLSSDTQPMVKTIVKTAFGIQNTGRIETMEEAGIRQKIADAITSSGFCSSSMLISQVLLLRSNLSVHSSVAITGSNFSGKTTVWRALAHLNEAEGIETHFVVVPTKLAPAKILYGSFDYGLNRWEDGILTSSLRHYHDMPGQSPKWIILDGDIDPSWACALESLIGSEKMLHVETKETFELTSSMKILFESVELSHASPSIISRIGISHIRAVPDLWQYNLHVWLKSVALEKSEIFRILEAVVERVFSALFVEVRSKPGRLEASKLILKLSFWPVVRMSLVIFGHMVKGSRVYLGMRQENGSYPDGSVAPDQNASIIVETLLLHSAVCSFSCLLKEEYISDFDDWIREFSQTAESNAIPYPNSRTCYDWMPQIKRIDDDGENISFADWNVASAGSKTMFSFDQPENSDRSFSLTNLCISCCSSYRSLYLLNLYKNENMGVAIVGPAISGKSVVMRTFLRTCVDASENVKHLTVCASSYTDSLEVCEALGDYLEEKAPGIFGAKPKETLYLFIDDVNNELKDDYGNQTCLSMLRHYFEFTKVYSKSTKSMVTLKNTNCFCSFNQSIISGSGPTRMKMSRCLNHAAVVTHRKLQETELLSLFRGLLSNQYCDFFYSNRSVDKQMAMRESYEGGASVLCDRILHGSISLNLQIKSMLTRTVRTPQYLFGVKQIARLIAVMMSVGANVVSKPVHLLEIWVQESKRIYGSVIESVEDSTKLDDAVHHACDMNMLNTSGDVEKRVEIDHADGLLKYHANDGEEAVAVWMAVSNFPSVKNSIFEASPYLYRGKGFTKMIFSEAKTEMQYLSSKFQEQYNGCHLLKPTDNLHIFRSFFHGFIKLCRLLSSSCPFIQLSDPGGYGDVTLAYIACLAEKVDVRDFNVGGTEHEIEPFFTELFAALLLQTHKKFCLVLRLDGSKKSSRALEICKQLASGYIPGSIFESEHCYLDVYRAFCKYCHETNAKVHTNRVRVLQELANICKMKLQIILCCPSSVLNKGASLFQPKATLFCIPEWKKYDFQHIAHSVLRDEGIDQWYFDGKSSFVLSVQAFLQSQEKYYPSYSETSAKVAQNALQFYSDGNNDKLGDPTFVKDAVAAFFADTHVTLLDMNKDADALEIVQPSDIIVAVQRFASVVKRRGMELKEQITKNVTAHCRFRFMCEVIPFVQEELDTAGKDLQTKTAIYDESNRYFVQESKKLEEIIQILKNSSEIVEASQQDVSRIEHELHTAWESAQPIQIEAQTQLDRIPKKDVTELKSFKSPIPSVLNMMKVVLLLFNTVHIDLHPLARSLPVNFVHEKGEPELLSWKVAQKIMINLTIFLKNLKRFPTMIDEMRVPLENFESIQKYLAMKDFDEKRIRRRSKAAAGIYRWLLLILKYWDAHMTHQPLREKLQQRREDLERALVQVETCKAEIDNVRKSKEDAKQKFFDANEAKIDAEQTLANLQLKMNFILEGRKCLNIKSPEWEKCIEIFCGSESVQLYGDVALTSVLSVYLSPCDSKKRDFVLESIVLPNIETHGLASATMANAINNTVQTHGVKEEYQRNATVLPLDNFLVENIAICKHERTHSSRTLCFIDYQTIANQYLSIFREGEPCVVTIHNDDTDDEPRNLVIQSILNCATAGKRLLVHIESRDLPPLVVKLMKTLAKNESTIMFSSRKIAVHHGFQMSLVVSNRKVNFPPKFRQFALVVQLQTSEKSLLSFFKQVIGEYDDSNRENVCRDLGRKVVKLGREVSRFSSSIDIRFTHASAAWMSDTGLLEELEDYYRNELTDTERLHGLTAQLTEPKTERDKYDEIANRMVDLFSIYSAVYSASGRKRVSLSAFCREMFASERPIATGSSVKKSIVLKNLVGHLTQRFVESMARVLRKEQILPFLLALLLKLETRSGECTSALINYLSSTRLAGSNTFEKNESPTEWLDAETWEKISYLSSLKEEDGLTYALGVGNLKEAILENSGPWYEWYAGKKPEICTLPNVWKGCTWVQKLSIVQCLRPDRYIDGLISCFQSNPITSEFVVDTRLNSLSKTTAALSPKSESDGNPKHYKFLLWLHSHIVHRSWYGKPGWNAGYEFTERFLLEAQQVLDNFGRSSRASAFLILDHVYGSVVADRHDKHLLSDIVMSAFESSSTGGGTEMLFQFATFAEMETNEECCNDFNVNFSTLMSGIEPPLEREMGIEESTNKISQILEALPRPGQYPDLESIELRNDCFRPYLLSYIQEQESFRFILGKVSQDLEALEKILRGTIEMEPRLKYLSRSLETNWVPGEWLQMLNCYAKGGLSVSSYIEHLRHIHRFHREWSSNVIKGDPTTPTIPLDLFFRKRLFISCFKLVRAGLEDRPLRMVGLVAVCHSKGIVRQSNVGGNKDIFLSGGKLEGASWNFQTAELQQINSPGIQQDFPIIHLSIQLHSEEETAKPQGGYENVVLCPAYGSRHRNSSLFYMEIRTTRDFQYWVRQGVAICFSAF